MALGTSSERVSYASGKLTKAYNKGSIVYPRVAFDYDSKKDFSFHPHPPIKQFDDFSTPLKFKKYPLIKDTLPLELANFNISTPSTLESTIIWTDKYYDDNMKPLSLSVEVSINTLLDKFYKHLEHLVNTYSAEDIVDKNNMPVADKVCKDGIVSNMKMELVPFRIKLKPSPTLHKEIRQNKKSIRKKKRSHSAKNFSGLRKKIVHVPSINEALALFQTRNLGIFYLRKKAEMLMREHFILRQEEFLREISLSEKHHKPKRQSGQ